MDPTNPTLSKSPSSARHLHFFQILKDTLNQWLEHKAPQLGAALAYYTVFSLAPLILIVLAVFGFIYGKNPATQQRVLEPVYKFLDPNSAQMVQEIANNAARPTSGLIATIVGFAIALFGATAVFGQLQDALNTIWGVKPKPGKTVSTFLHTRFLSFTIVAGVCFLLLVSLIASTTIRGFSHYIQTHLPLGSVFAWGIDLLLNFGIVSVLFAIIFKFLPDAKIEWRDVRLGAMFTAALFLIGKYALSIYLGSGSVSSAYGAAGSLISMLLWIYYSSQIVLFGAEFTHVYSISRGKKVVPTEYAVLIEDNQSQEALPQNL